MQPNYKPLATALAAILQLTAIAAVPIAWTNAPGMPPYMPPPVPHGSKVEFSVTLKGFTDPAISADADVRLWYQTNGMGTAWFSAPATFASNVITAAFGPAQDTGADRVNCFFGAPSNVFASAVLRLTHAPGFTPAAIELPRKELDFSAIELRNISALTNGWSFGSVMDLEPATNYTAQSLASFAATGTVKKARSATSAGSADRATEADVATFAYNLYASDWTSWTVPSLLRASTNAAETVVGQHASDMSNPHNVTAEQIGAAPSSLVQAVTNLQVESTLVYRLYQGSNVVAEVTNYNSQVHAPAIRLMQLNESNEYVTVWTETNGLARTLRAATNYADRAIADYAAPRAWSATTSGLGADAPPNTTWVSTPRTVIAGGLEYAKVVDTFGEVWVLTSNGMAAEFNPDTNAYFRITADDGTDIFSIEKSDAQVVGADADGITVGESSVIIPVGVVSAEHPTMFWRQALDSGSWADESSPPTGATVAWSGTAGAYVCTVTWSGTRPSSMFFRFTFLQEGGVVIRNNASTDISAGIYVNGVKFIPSVSGNNLIWTKQQ